MSDPYPGYWLASDGNWYPVSMMPPPSPQAQPPVPPVPPPYRPPTPSAGGSGKNVLARSLGALALVGVAGLIAIGFAGSDDTVTTSPTIEPASKTSVLAPTSEVIATVAPETAPPATAAPTQAPTTPAPPPTEPPTTQAPAPPPAPTAAPRTSPPATQPPPTSPPATAPPATFAAPLPVAGGCDPNYTPCVPANVDDVDCAGGSGNGPEYVHGPITVIGNDHYGLDNDHDGVGCESG